MSTKIRTLDEFVGVKCLTFFVDAAKGERQTDEASKQQEEESLENARFQKSGEPKTENVERGRREGGNSHKRIGIMVFVYSSSFFSSPFFFLLVSRNSPENTN